VDLGLLPADTIIATGGPKKKNGGTTGSRPASSRPRKRHKSKDSPDGGTTSLLLGTSTRPASSVLRRNSNSGSSSRHGSVDDDEEIEQEDGPPQEVQATAPTKRGEADVPGIMDPERALEVAGMSISERKEMCLPVTVHWDPASPDGNKIGWKLKIKIKHEYHEGRVVRYDPCTHKHKVQLVPGGKTLWIWLRNEQHELQVATRIVWALVKGFSWWPVCHCVRHMYENLTYPYIPVRPGTRD
jgi:hypothetical protein